MGKRSVSVAMICGGTWTHARVMDPEQFQRRHLNFQLKSLRHLDRFESGVASFRTVWGCVSFPTKFWVDKELVLAVEEPSP